MILNRLSYEYIRIQNKILDSKINIRIKNNVANSVFSIVANLDDLSFNDFSSTLSIETYQENLPTIIILH